MSLLWIRHGEKKFKNGKGIAGYSQHDPPLKENSDTKIHILGHNIYLNFGIPDKIVSSPFLRTRETAAKLIQFFRNQYSVEIPMTIDNNIGEFLGWIRPKGIKADVTRETSNYIQPILGIERVKDVEERSKKHVEAISKTDKILIITHGIVIEFITKHLTGKKMHKVKELSGICLSGGKLREFNLTY